MLFIILWWMGSIAVTVACYDLAIPSMFFVFECWFLAIYSATAIASF